MEKPLFGIDCDDVLIDLNSVLHPWHNAKYGTAIQFEEIYTYQLEKIWDVSREEAIRRAMEFYETELASSLSAMDGAVDALQQLKERFDLVVITSRPVKIKPLTLKVLDNHFPDIFRDVIHTDAFNLAGSGISKAEVCKRLGVKVFMDDHLLYLEEIASAGNTTPYLFRRPWNLQFSDETVREKGVTPVDSWLDFVNIMTVKK